MGDFGRDWAARVLPAVPAVELAGCVDPDPTARKLARGIVQLPSRRLFARLAESLASVEPDAVLVTTMLPGHVPVARAALEAVTTVLVEKPFAPSVSEGQELVQLAAERGLTLMVSQNYLFFRAGTSPDLARRSVLLPHLVGSTAEGSEGPAVQVLRSKHVDRSMCREVLAPAFHVLLCRAPRPGQGPA